MTDEPMKGGMCPRCAELEMRAEEAERLQDDDIARCEELTMSLRNAIQEREEARAEVERLRKELMLLTESSAKYMEYHTEKFYGDSPSKPTGLWPAINRARSVTRVLFQGGRDGE